MSFFDIYIMEKVVISWIARNNDFLSEGGQIASVNPDGPTAMLHADWFSRQHYTRHLLLSSEKEGGIMGEWIGSYIRKRFPGHPVEIHYLAIQDVIDLREIHQKVQGLLHHHRKTEWDFYISPGTSMMQIAWFILHQEGSWQSRLLQGRKPKDSRSKQQEFFYIELEQLPPSALLNIMPRKEAGDALDNLQADNLYTGKVLEPVYNDAQRIARIPKKIPILIRGETGTGKEELARYIHRQARLRDDEPFVAVNCASIPDEMLYGELFGYAKGAFTGAVQDHKGYFEQANGGTLFLDEIGDISAKMQVSLLRAIQENKIRPLGKGKETTVSVRLITATHRNLEVAIEQAQFREDLYYRISRVELDLPPLRIWPDSEKKKLIHHILDKLIQDYELQDKRELSASAIQLLLEYPYPGNIRELFHILERAIIHGQRVILPDMFPQRVLKRLEQNQIEDNLENALLRHVVLVYEKYKRNKKVTCEKLGLGSPNTLNKYLQKQGIED